jgi:hypothetical protein
LVWNIHPDDQLKQIKFYVIRDRGYSITGGANETYYPRIQMNLIVSLEEKSYGVLQIPKEWASFITSLKNTQSAKQPNLFFNQFSAERQVFYGWIPYDRNNKETFTRQSVNGNGYSNGGVNTDYLMILNESDVEIR